MDNSYSFFIKYLSRVNMLLILDKYLCFSNVCDLMKLRTLVLLVIYVSTLLLHSMYVCYSLILFTNHRFDALHYSFSNRWFGIQLNPQFMGIDLKYVSHLSIMVISLKWCLFRMCYYIIVVKPFECIVMCLLSNETFFCRFFFVRAGMMGWLLINLSVLAKCIQEANLNRSMILYQLFCAVSSFIIIFG